MWIAVVLLGSTACRSTLEAVRSPEEPGQALARFEGTLGLPERELRRAAAADLEDLALSVTEEARPDPAHADDAAFAVEAALRAAGFPDAVCSFQLDPASGAVTLSVEAGPRCVLEEVELLGEPKLLPRSQLALLFEGPRLGLLGRGEPVFVETRVRSAPRAIVREYRARGHLESIKHALLRRSRVLLRDSLLRVPLAEFRANLEALIATVKDAGAQPLVVLPAFPERTIARFPTGGRYLEVTRDVVAQTGVPFVDATAVVERFEADQDIREPADASALTYTDWIHPSGIGHGLIARAISAELESIGWPGEAAAAPSELTRPEVRCDVADGVANVTWGAVAGAEGYSIYFEELVTGKIGAFDCGGDTTFQMSLRAPLKFRFCVQAHRWGSQGPCSETITVGG